jgi:lipopolysaccharide export LptBFGC system permease protein LptF
MSLNEFKTIGELSKEQKLIPCYQMQLEKDTQKCKPVLLGNYPEIPLIINKQIEHDKYILNVVTYVLTEEEVKNKIFKIVGVMIFEDNGNDSNESISSVDLIMNDDNGEYELILNDHKTNKTIVLEKLETFPKKNEVLDMLVSRVFHDSIKDLVFTSKNN